MSEFWGFSAVLTTIDRDLLVGLLAKLKVKDAVIHYYDDRTHVIAASRRELRRLADVVIEFDDHESAAWDFSMYVKGKRIGGGIFGTNAETSAEDQGFDGDITAVAARLGVDRAALEATFVPSSNAFLELTRLTLLPAGSGDVEPGSGYLFTDEEEPRRAVANKKPAKAKPAKAKPPKAKPPKAKPAKKPPAKKPPAKKRVSKKPTRAKKPAKPTKSTKAKPKAKKRAAR